MRSVGTIIVASMLLTLTACRPDSVELAYIYTEGGTLHYEMVADAEASWDIGGRGSGSYSISYDVEERVVAVHDSGATVEVTMTPTDIEEKGLPSPGPTQRTFQLEVSVTGELLGVLEIDGVPAEALEPEDLAFIGTYRPPLPQEPARLRDTWTAHQELRIEPNSQEVTTLGRLETLDLDEDGEVADISYLGEGPLFWTTTLPQGAAELQGTASSTGVATVSIDHGYLVSSASTTTGDLDVIVTRGAGEAALTGRLSLELNLRLTRVPAPPDAR